MFYCAHIQLEYHSNSFITKITISLRRFHFKVLFYTATRHSVLIFNQRLLYSKLCFKELFMYYLSSSWEAETKIDRNSLCTII